MNKPHLMFDFDGTIADTLHAGLDAYNRIAENEGYRKIDEKNMQALRALGFKEVLQELGISVFKAPLIATRLKKEIREEVKELNTIPGMRETIDELKRRGYNAGIVTFNTADNVQGFLKKNGLNHFDYVYSDVSMFGKGKIIKKLLKKMGIDPKDAVYIGDESRDMEAAREAGVKAMAVTWGINARLAFEKYDPEYIVDKPEDMLKVFV